MNTSLDKDVKEGKKTAEAKPGTSPTSSTPNSEEATLLSEFPGNNNGTTNEEEIKEKLTPSSDVLLEGLSPFIAEESSRINRKRLRKNLRIWRDT